MYHYGFNSTNWLYGPGVFFPGPFGMIVTLLFWGLILILLVRGISYLLGTRRDLPQKRDTALEILRERYARGEIDKEEFVQMKRDLIS